MECCIHVLYIFCTFKRGTITAFPGFVNVFNNSYFWLWYSRFRTCNFFIVIAKWSYFSIQIPLSHSNIHAVTWSENLKDGMLYTCTIHFLYIQKRCNLYLIIILYIVFFFIIIPTVSQLTYLFSGEVAALFSSYRLVYVI
jgi:hypothetical protein